MRRLWGGLGLLAAFLLVGGCTSTEKRPKPPKPKEEYTLPPEEDGRYSKWPEYPKGVFEEDPLLKKAKDANKEPGGLPSRMPGQRFGGGGGGGPF
jgi:hypothetical protein